MNDPREWLDDLDVVELDSDKLRALAHPTRNRIAASLRMDGPATSAVLATRLGTNTGQTSYHLRVLADVGLVVEDPDRGTGRERWWKSAHRGHHWSEARFEEDPDDRHAADWLKRHYHRLYTQWVSEWHEHADDWSRDWRDAALSGDSYFMASPDLVRELAADLVALMDRYRERGNELDADDEDVHRVTVIYHAFPSEHVRP